MNTDIKLSYADPYFDLSILDNDLEFETELRTALIISLFSDRRVTQEELPVEDRDRRGWWADAVNEDEDQIGSKLWLLKREKITPQVIARAKQYCEEALQWLIDDGIADGVNVTAERADTFQVSIEIEIIRDHDSSGEKYAFVWESIA